jgi:mannan endo-1,4-beta-mannosidase
MPQVSATPLSTNTPVPTATPEVIITDWRGEYYANAALSGEPALIRNDLAIDFNWGAGSPDPRLPADQFSARWMRQVGFEQAQYRFVVSSDDGVRLWVDGQPVLNEWHDGTLTDYSVNLDMSQGKHFLQLEYYENSGGAMVRLIWAKVELPTATPTLTPMSTPTPMPTNTPLPTELPTPTDTPLPTDTPTPTDTPLPTDTPTPTDTPPPISLLPDRWRAQYFDNPLLTGDPVLVREDAAIQFDWGEGSPGPGVPADGFSARWTGEVWLPSGGYRYLVTADDGARVLIDGQPVLLAWPALPGQTYQIWINLLEGTHVFQVEYFEGTGVASIHLWAE